MDVTQWDDGGTVSPVGGSTNTSTVQRLYIDPRDNLWILWGQNTYSTFDEAVSLIGADDAATTVPSLLASASILLGYIVSERGKTDWDSNESRFVLATGSGGGGSAFTPTTFAGALTTGYVPDSLTESKRLLVDDGSFQNRVHALPYIDANLYYPQDMVFQDGWLMVANKQTTDYPAPTESGPPEWTLGDTPAWQEFSNIKDFGYGCLRLA
jgi:hypothetical protein